MPDDQILEEEQVEEQEPTEDDETGNDDALSAFEEDDDDDDEPLSFEEDETEKEPTKKEKPPKKPPKKEKDETPEKDEEQEEPNPEDEKEGGETKKEDLTAQQRAEQRGLELEEQLKASPKKEKPTGEEDPQGKGKKAPEEEDDKGKKAPKKLTKEKVALHLKAIDIDSLPDDEFVIGDDVVNLKEYADVDPEGFKTVVVVADMIAEKRLEALKEAGGFVSKQDMEDLQEGVSQTIENLMFQMRLTEVHSDWRKVTATKDWKEWMEPKPDHVKIIQNLNDVKAASDLIQWFKDDMSKKKAETRDKKKRGKHDRNKDINKDTLREAAPKGIAAAQVDMNDAEAAFDEDDD